MIHFRKILHVIDSFACSFVLTLCIFITVAGCLKRAYAFERDLSIPVCPASVCVRGPVTVQTAQYEFVVALQFVLFMSVSFPLMLLWEVYMFTKQFKAIQCPPSPPSSSSEEKKETVRVPSPTNLLDVLKKVFKRGSPQTEEGVDYHEFGV